MTYDKLFNTIILLLMTFLSNTTTVHEIVEKKLFQLLFL